MMKDNDIAKLKIYIACPASPMSVICLVHIWQNSNPGTKTADVTVKGYLSKLLIMCRIKFTTLMKELE